VRVATLTGLGLAQVGEFSFILAKAGLPQGLLSEADYQRFLAASIISMIATPFLINAAPRVGYLAQSFLSPRSLLEPSVAGFDLDEPDLRGHVVIIGYGLNGRNLARVLRKVGVQYLVLELNAQVVREASAWGERIVYGDATRKEVLQHVGLERARILVVAVSDPVATRHAVWLARQMNPDIHAIVRTRYMSELQDLLRLGADDVIPEEFETSIEIFSRVLREYGIARDVIRRRVEEVRREGYEMLRTPSLAPVEMRGLAEALGSASTETLFVEPDSPVVGKTIGDLKLRSRTGATVIAVVHEGRTEINPGPERKLEAEDVLVLLGSPEQIEMATSRITPSENEATAAGA
jgi:K+:H+ antiporter